MQIIQNIRDKGAAIVIVVIALSLIGFLLMDTGRSNFFGKGAGDQNVVGKVNGEKIDLIDFNKKVKMAEEQQAAQSGRQPSGPEAARIREQVWNQVVAEKVFFNEAEKLGISLTPKELSAILLSNDPQNPFLREQSLLGPDGKLDIAKAQEALGNIKKFKDQKKEAVNQQIIDPLKIQTAAAKYGALINAGAYYPTWMQEQDAANSTNFATISYVAVPYTEISDSTVKVTDADVNAYVAKNKALFKQEAGRKVSYVTFSQLPSATDSADQMKALAELKPLFVGDSNTKAFVARHASVIEYRDDYIPKSKLDSPLKDSISSLANGTVFGPYLQSGTFALAKVLGSKQVPDSAKARHILISIGGEKGTSDSSAKKLADSLLAVINGGGNFAALAAQFSEDPGSKDKGGVYESISYGQMVPEFNDFVFNKPVGSKGVVKTQYGYHIIDVMNQKNFGPAYKIGFVAKDIVASEVTLNAASLAATKASAQKDGKALSEYASKNGLAVVQLPNILKETDYSAGALQDARQIVRWAFDAKEGQVSESFNVGSEFVVATLVKKYSEGVQDAETARSGAEAIIIKEKKAEIIKKKLGANPTLEKAAADYNKTVAVAGADSSITFGARLIPGLGMEPKIVGAAFNKEYQSKPSPAIAGTSGVYVLKTTAIATKPANPGAGDQMRNALRQELGNWYEGLRKNADIKDSRGKVF